MKNDDYTTLCGWPKNDYRDQVYDRSGLCVHGMHPRKIILFHFFFPSSSSSRSVFASLLTLNVSNTCIRFGMRTHEHTEKKYNFRLKIEEEIKMIHEGWGFSFSRSLLFFLSHFPLSHYTNMIVKNTCDCIHLLHDIWGLERESSAYKNQTVNLPHIKNYISEVMRKTTHWMGCTLR